ncbi:MAG: homoserine kinase [Gammaproteobacteria bacterium]|nr:homoserine kinase [Gammaproteobacteria bacterium]
MQRTVSLLDRETLEELVARYDIGQLLEQRPACRGIENRNYFIMTAQDGVRRDWVLTVLEQPSHAGSSYVPLLDLCHESGLPVAPVIRNVAGDAIESVDGKRAMLSAMLPGQHVDSPSVEQARALGRFIGEFHRAARRPEFKVPAYPRNGRWLRDRESEVRGRLADPDARLGAHAVQRVADLLDREDVARLPSGPVHGDLFRDNVLFNGPKLTGVVDFHHAAHGYLVYDLAVAVNDWCSGPDGALDLQRSAALARAYHGVRPLGGRETRLFADFLLYAALAFWLSRLTVAARAGRDSTTRFKDPDEFKAIVLDRGTHLSSYQAFFRASL